MSKKEDWKDMFDRLDAGESNGISPELKADHSLLIKGINYLEEDAFREKLAQVQITLAKEQPSGKRVYWILGIAASLAAIFLIWNSRTTQPGEFDLKMDEVPAYADSASFDSLKNSNLDVDKTENLESIEN